VPFKEHHIKKVYYSIGEVSEMFDVAPSLIRFWESEFDSLKPKKNHKGNRQYSIDDIEELKLIYYLVKERGYTIPGAREKLRLDRKKALDNMHAVKSLEKVKRFLIDLKNNL